MPDGEDELPAWSIADVGEFAAYGPILGCLIVPLCGVALALAWMIQRAGAPAWATSAVAIAYATFPYGAFTWWTWNKKALRLSNGRVLSARAARCLAFVLWLTVASCLVIRFARW